MLAREDAAQRPSRRQVLPGARRGRAARRRRERVAKPADVARADVDRADDGRVMQLLRRPASVVLRQRREGDGRRQAGLSGACRASWRGCRRPSARAAELLRPGSTTSCAPTVHARRSPDADHRRGRGARRRSPRARFEPGQFYRLQNFEALARRQVDGTLLAMEGLALTGAWVDRGQGPALD